MPTKTIACHAKASEFVCSPGIGALYSGLLGEATTILKALESRRWPGEPHRGPLVVAVMATFPRVRDSFGIAETERYSWRLDYPQGFPWPRAIVEPGPRPLFLVGLGSAEIEDVSTWRLGPTANFSNR